jgi:hypothetical protein
MYQIKEYIPKLFFYPEDGSSTFLLNFGDCLPDHKAFDTAPL